MTAAGAVAAERRAVRAADAQLRTAFLVSTTGDWIYRLAVPLLVLKLTGSAVSTAFAYTLEFVPYVLLGPLAGVLADRSDRRRTLVVCDAVSAVLAAGIALLAALPDPPLGLVYLSVFLLACVRPVYFPAFQGLLVELVAGDRLTRVNSWTQTVDSALGMLGPVAGTALVAATGTATATGINAVSFAASALLVAGIRHHRPAGTGASWRSVRGVGRDLAEGLRVISAARAVVWGVALMTVSNLAVFVVEGNLFYLLLTIQGHSKIVVGAVLSGQGLGAVVGAALAPRLIGRYPSGRLLGVSMGLIALCIWLPAAAPVWPVLTVAWTLLGLCVSVTVVAWYTARQQIIPPEAAGRVAAVSRAVAYTTIPVGSLLGAVVLSGGGAARPLFAVAAVTQVAVFLATLGSPFGRIDDEIRRATAPNG